MWSKIAVGLAAVVVACGAFALGRESADRDAARKQGHADGIRAGKAVGLREGRAIGIRAGRAAGVLEGRALQASKSAPPGSRTAARRAFEKAYAAGANDVFSGFDGGWSFEKAYLITLRRGSGAITYRIDSRVPTRLPTGTP